MEETKRRPVARRRHLSPPPQINTIDDLLAINTKYANIDNEMLERIREPLEKINGLVGMKSLKKTLLHQVLYYLQHLSTKKDNYLHTVILGPPGIGKCIHPSSELITFDGQIISASELTTAHVLMGDNCEPRRVLSICHGEDEMYRLQDKWMVNSSHVLSLVHPTKTEFADVPLDEYLRGKKWKTWQSWKTTVSFPYRFCSVDAYIAGYTLLKLKRFPNLDNFIHVRNSFIQSYFRASQCVKSVVNDGFELDLNYFEETPEILARKIPLIFRANRSDIMYYFLAGVYDGANGTALNGNATENRTASLYVCGKDLFRDLVFLHSALGIEITATRMVSESIVNDKVSECEYFSISRPSFIPSLFTSFSTFWGNSAPATPKIRRFPVSVEHIGREKYIGFELDGNGRFLFSDFLVSHNTTIACLIGELYKKMGILSENSVFRVAKRDDFVAEYLGQTATKTTNLLNSCIGGVLFIDEIYSFGNDAHVDTYSKEAIDTINLFLSENSNSFCCIIAGYEEEVNKCFFSINKGLERRFPWVHKLEPYTFHELAEIFVKLLSDIGWTTHVPLERIASIISDNRLCFVYNGGDVCNYITKCKISHSIRILYEKTPARFCLTEQDLLVAVDMMRQHSEDDDGWKTMYM